MPIDNRTAHLVRRPYAAPALRIYGRFSHLTASGSGPLRENNRGMGQPFRRP